MELLMILLVTVIPVISDGLSVRGPSAPLVAPLGSSVVLLCSVDEPLPVEGLEVEWRRPDSETLVHLYQDGASQTEVQQQDYQDRAHFFTEEIQHGNFSLRLDDLRAEDEGQYTCTVHGQQDSGETVVQINIDVERLLVSGSSRSISASVGEDVTLNCSVDSHITLQDIEQVSWKKTDEDEEIQVLLYQDNEILPEASDQRYSDRVEFFRDEIPKFNFSLRLKSVRTEDKGVYMCEVLAGGLSANTTVELERLGFSVSHIMVLILCVSASGSALLLCCLIYCRSLHKGFFGQQTYNHQFNLGSSVVLPCHVDECLLKKNLKVEWRRADSETLVHLYEDGESRAKKQHKDYQHRAHFITDEIKDGNVSLRLDKVRAEDAGKYTCKVYREQDCVHSADAELEMLDPVFRLHMSLVFCPNVLMLLAFVLWGVSEGSVSETVCCCALYFLRPLLLLWAAPYIYHFTGKINSLILKYSYVVEYLALSVVVYSALFTSAWQKLLNYDVFERAMIIVLFVIVFVCCLCKIIYILVTEVGKKSGRIVKIFDLVADMTFQILPTLQFILLFYTFGAAGEAGLIMIVVLPVLLMMMTNDRWLYKCFRLGLSESVVRTVMLIFILVTNVLMIGLYIFTLENQTDPIGWGCVMVFLQILWTVMYFTDAAYSYLSLSRDFQRYVSVYVFGSVAVVLLNSAALITELILKTVNGDRMMADLRFIVFPSECLFAVSLLISGFSGSKIAGCLKSCQTKVRSIRVRRSSQQNQSTEMNPLNAGDQERIQPDSVLAQT
uniref:Ig-like domain-containing protein n=1 Tax=Cyprinus carpio carpio TaxID=630221 RepID=A0A9J8CTL0_CYPCA